MGLALYSGNNSASESRKNKQSWQYKMKLRKNEDNIQKASTYQNSMLSSIYFRSSHADFQYSKGTSSVTYCDYKYYISSWASSHLLHQSCHFHISGKPLGISPALSIPKIRLNQSNCTSYLWKCVYMLETCKLRITTGHTHYGRTKISNGITETSTLVGHSAHVNRQANHTKIDPF